MSLRDLEPAESCLRAALSRHCCSEWEIAECATAEAAVAEMSSTSDSRYDLVLMDDHFEVNDAHDSACMHAQHRPSAHSPQIPCAPSLSQPPYLHSDSQHTVEAAVAEAAAASSLISVTCFLAIAHARCTRDSSVLQTTNLAAITSARRTTAFSP